MNTPVRTIRQEARAVLIFIAVVWAVYLLDFLLYYFHVDLNSFGLTPRTAWGLLGIVTMPFLHGGLFHLLGNTISLAILLLLLASSRPKWWLTAAAISLLGGALLWLVGRSATHVGASGLVFGLVTFLVLTGLLEKRLIPILVSVFVLFLYGGPLVAGILPFSVSRDVSWDGHLCGALAGAAVAYANHRRWRRIAAPKP